MFRCCRNLIPVQRPLLINPISRQLSLTSIDERRGYTGSKTQFYSSLGHRKHLKFRRHTANRMQDPPVEEMLQLKGGSNRFKVGSFALKVT